MKQKTIKKPVTVSGIGLHTGAKVNMTFNPAPENHGYKFQRIDLPEKPIIEADVDLVVSTARGTKLAKNGVEIGTVEHVLAACYGLGIDNLLIELDAHETPIMDGSADYFVKALLSAGIIDQNADKEYFEVTSNIIYSAPGSTSEMIAMPADAFRMTVMIDYNSPILGSQYASLFELNDFKKEISTCRTFCLLSEVEELYNQNLIRGGDIDNAVVIVDKKVSNDQMKDLAQLIGKPVSDLKAEQGGILNNVELRFQNEPARHKLLDFIGDLALIGVPLKAQIMAARPGHTVNIEFARKVKKALKIAKLASKNAIPVYNPNATPAYNSWEIEKILPHRYPFNLVDKVLEVNEKHIIGIKNVTFDEPYFQGHFPGNPVMPGVLQIEALAQLGGILGLHDKPDPEKYDTYFLKIDNTKFKEKVRPGDTLLLKVEMLQPVRRGMAVMSGKAFVGNKLVVETEFMAQIVKNA